MSRRPSSHPMSHPKTALPKEPLKSHIVEILAHYAAPAGRSGRRAVFVCPVCEKPKIEALGGRGIGGCFNTGCPVPTTTDALGLIAFFEDLDPYTRFPEIVRIGHEILGPFEILNHTDHAPTHTRTVEPPDPDLLDAVYQRLLALSPTSPAALRFWRTRGIEKQTVIAGGFGSTTPAAARRTIRDLTADFGEDLVLRVPGFFRNAEGRVSMTLTGDYALIPYHAPGGNITTVEGRSLTDQQTRQTAKYVSLRDSGSHLYVFPGTPIAMLQAFCEGALGAILAAQEGVPVGAIKGIRCHQSPDGGPLPELVGARFGGRSVPYVPDSDHHLKDSARRTLHDEALRAARNLNRPHGGQPALARLPKAAQDLDSWLLALPKQTRGPSLRRLLDTAAPLVERPAA